VRMWRAFGIAAGDEEAGQRGAPVVAPHAAAAFVDSRTRPVPVSLALNRPPHAPLPRAPPGALLRGRSNLNLLIGMLFITWLVSMLPASFVICFFVGLSVAGCVRMSGHVQMLRYRQGIAQRLRSSLQQPAAGGHAASSGSQPAPRGREEPASVQRQGLPGMPPLPTEDSWVIFHQQQPEGVDMANLQLSILRASLAEAGIYPPPAPEVAPPPQPLSEVDLATLATYPWKAPERAGRGQHVRKTARPASQQPSQLQPQADGPPPRQPLPPAGKSVGKHRGADVERASGSDADSGCSDDDCPKCPVCLDAFSDGERVLLLRCMHQFHHDCVMPWLQRHGRTAQCPVCKTAVFLS